MRSSSLKQINISVQISLCFGRGRPDSIKIESTKSRMPSYPFSPLEAERVAQPSASFFFARSCPREAGGWRRATNRKEVRRPVQRLLDKVEEASDELHEPQVLPSCPSLRLRHLPFSMPDKPDAAGCFPRRDPFNFHVCFSNAINPPSCLPKRRAPRAAV